eukprot:761193-Hanusia_phi.AAC.2
MFSGNRDAPKSCHVLASATSNPYLLFLYENVTVKRKRGSTVNYSESNNSKIVQIRLGAENPESVFFVTILENPLLDRKPPISGFPAIKTLPADEVLSSVVSRQRARLPLGPIGLRLSLMPGISVT